MAETHSDKVPSITHLINPTLKALHVLGGSATPNELADKVISKLNLSSEVVTRVYPDSATPILHRYLASARTILKSNGLIDNSERGVWTLTAKGKITDAVDASKARTNYRKYRRDRKSNGDERDITGPDDQEIVEDDPEQWRDDLSRVLQGMPWDGFERLCRRLLRESGFTEVTVKGKSGDEGIDGTGIIRLSELVSFPVVFQCKRYVGSVSSGEVRNFRGSMPELSARGLFLTTGRFTQAAKREARKDGRPPIDLIDGEALVDLLKKLKLGVKVTERTVEDVEIVSEFFENV